MDYFITVTIDDAGQMPFDVNVPFSVAIVIKSASSVLTTRLPWEGQVLSQKSNMSLASSASHFKSSSASTAVSMPFAPPKTTIACEKLGIDDVTDGDIGVPLSEVPIVRSYPFYANYIVISCAMSRTKVDHFVQKFWQQYSIYLQETVIL